MVRRLSLPHATLRARLYFRSGFARTTPISIERENSLTAFEQLGLAEKLVRAVRAEDYHTPTPIQAQAIPVLLTGRDLMGCAQTGTGKTAAFALPTMQRLCETSAASFTPAATDQEGVARFDAAEYGGRSRETRKRNPRHPASRRGATRPIRSLILAPTRELAAQISASFATYGRHTGLRYTVVYGGVGQGPQVRALRDGVDILVATPGRLLDLMEQGYIDLRKVEILILDEADQMLDMGFIVPLRKIVASVPRERQTLMFSATMPPEIRKLASEWLRDPAHVQVAPVATPAELVEQSVYLVEQRNKVELLTHYLQKTATGRTLVFSRTKHGADKIVKHLSRAGIRAAALHGNKSQSVRQRTLDSFKSDRPPVLVATDIAARGLDVDAISHVINYDLPDVAEVYVHRIGRTGRAGATGIATSFCGRDERDLLRQIERLTRQTLTIEESHPEHLRDTAPMTASSNGNGNRNNNRRGQGNVSRGASGGRRPRRRTSGSGRPATAHSAGSANGTSSSGGGAAASQSASRPKRPKKRRILARL
jgi:ATP-dependent RNA helicase RhlE